MKTLGLLLLSTFLLPGCNTRHARVVSADKMQEIFEEIRTPYKYGLVKVPEDDSKKVDCPSIFRADGKWHMTYLVFDGRGYETWLAKSDNLLEWEDQGRILSFSDTAHWDGNQKAGYVALQDHEWGGSYQLNRFDDSYWMSYFGGPASGYERGDLAIGIARTTGDPATPHEWNRLDKPVLTALDDDARWWDNRKIFKSSVIWDQEKTTGYPFVMYYNANGDSAENNLKTRWFERIGMAVSDDMVHWRRFGEQPVVHHPAGITGDAVVQKIGDVWVMFYFGAFWENKEGGFNRFACSYDLVNWTDWEGGDLIAPSEAYDSKFAHKSFVIKHEGTVYHFYCAVNDKDQRGIALATSRDMGKSTRHFAIAP